MNVAMITEPIATFPSFRAGQAVSAAGALRALDAAEAIAAASADPTQSLYVPATAASDPTVWANLARDPSGPAWIDALERSCGRSLRAHNGLAAFRVGDAGFVLLPSFPSHAMLLDDAIRSEPLRSLLASQFTVGVALIRLGRYAIAVYQGQQLAVSKTDTRYVKSRHRAGGTSQQRFRRIRENQIHRLYVEAAGILEQQWQPWLAQLDYVVLGGETATINGFIKECPALARLASITLPHRLDVREPNRAALDALGPTLYQCRAYPLRWGQAG